MRLPNAPIPERFDRWNATVLLLTRARRSHIGNHEKAFVYRSVDFTIVAAWKPYLLKHTGFSARRNRGGGGGVRIIILFGYPAADESGV